MPKKPRWADEEWKWEFPDPNEVVCKDCVFREPDAKAGKTLIDGATKSMCEVYNLKPHGILFHGEDCDYYMSEDEQNAADDDDDLDWEDEDLGWEDEEEEE